MENTETIKQIKELEEKQQDLKDVVYTTRAELEEINNLLDLVIDFIIDQHKADLNDYMSCWDLVNFVQKYNTLLKVAREKTEFIEREIEKVI